MTTQLSIPENALSVKETPPFSALCFTTRATLGTLAQHVGGVAETMYREADRLNLHVTGPIHWIYTGASGDQTMEFQLEIVLPIERPGGQPEGFSYKVFSPFRCVAYTYAGPWSDFGQVYDALFNQFYRDGYQKNDFIREVYSVMDFENPANCVTEIQIGLA